jgi:ADP-ribose pyrophosphatase
MADDPVQAAFYWAVLIVLGLSMFSLHVVMYTAFLKEPTGRITVLPEDPKPPPKSNRRVEVLEKHRDYDGVYKVDRARLRFERFDGRLSKPVTRLVFERGDSVCVLPYAPEKDAVLLIQQFRYPTYLRNGPGYLWEIVAGVQDRSRDRVAVAHAELLEEAGYQVETLVPIMSFYLSPGACSERIYLYLAYVTSENHVSQGGGLAAEDEDIAVSLVSFQDAMNMIDSGSIVDAKTIAALQWLALHKGNLPRVPLRTG